MQTLKKTCVIFLLFFAAFVVPAQNLDRKITLRIKSKPLGEVINEIGQKANINFSYSTQNIPVEKPVSIKARNASVRSILDELLKKYSIEFTVVESQVILKAIKNTIEPWAEKQII